MIIDYAFKGLRNDFLDVYLGATCDFCISNGTGYDALPYIFRRPILYVDHVPFGIINTFSKRNIATTKKHYLIEENRYMHLEEILKSPAMWYPNSHDFKFLGKIRLDESSPEEIKNVVLEMEGRYSNTWVTSDEDEQMQKYFWSLFPRNDETHGKYKHMKDLLHGKLYSRVGTDFLKTRLLKKFD